ncbi:lipocalin-like domain-containing protein [Pelagicoccus sp. SDUM812002]|uniref:lipocalin-like domain-containing protein n=1 Tax=Pelagicoccus sp. SDUM812002 TaxID=3041266 RepID=UPI00280F18FE|nr:lipocalin-like domain-containing protein [Pelagicoccus sp. SDUM812002]MDQ8187028.1 lipocalin-like domain-containing protein [Pelagicoccus sp. SDUM812002]
MKLLATILVSWASVAAYCAETPFPVEPDTGFAIARPETVLQFPRDHGSHPQFKTEWWYITGHLDSLGQELGFQITFFRSASKDTPGSTTEQVYLAHAAIVDKRSGRFIHEERLNSDDWNAAAKVGTLDLYNGNWYLKMLDPQSEQMKTRFSLKDIGVLELTLTPAKQKTLFGEDGYSKKGDEKGAASHYITFTRLKVSGTLKNQQTSTSVSGLAWMDHEFSSSQLSSDQIGWNWSSLILDDGSELMAYVMRREDGAVDPNSRLTLISHDGEKTELKGSAFRWAPLRNWNSPHSEASYPVEYEISWGDRKLRIEPFADDQELAGSIGDFVYWEGACRVFDEENVQIGIGYTELTGYTESLKGKF